LWLGSQQGSYKVYLSLFTDNSLEGKWKKEEENNQDKIMSGERFLPNALTIKLFHEQH